MFGKSSPYKLIIGVLIVALIGLGFAIFRRGTTPPADSPEGQYTFMVEEGMTIDEVGDMLIEDRVIRNGAIWEIAKLIVPLDPLQQGEYFLETPAIAREILGQINDNSSEIREINLEAGNVPTVRVTIREGQEIEEVFDLLEEKGVANKSDLARLSNSPDLFQSNYPFLPTPLGCNYGDEKSCIKYYLEGYLYPDTYRFVVGGDPQDVLEVMLNNFQNKVYNNLTGEQQNPGELFRTLVIASLIENETGRPLGVTDDNIDELNQERRIMAGVFENRLEQGIPMESDPTVTYGLGGLQVCQQTFDIEGCVFLDDPRVDTAYNTYAIAGLPIGPTTSPQWAVIDATLNSESNNYLFFVSDITGKKYFAETNSEHVANIEFVAGLNDQISQ